MISWELLSWEIVTSEHRLLQKLEYEDKGEYFTHL